MPWIEANLRGQKVFARANARGELVAEGGRVEIRYNRNDGRAYRAAAGNLIVGEGAAILPDDHCGAAEAAPQKKSEAPSRVDPKTTWLVYADGACSGNPGPAGAGYVVIPPGGSPKEGFEYLGIATNNIAELTAILNAVEAIPNDGKPVVVRTDSQYSIGVLQKGWKAKANQALVAHVKKAVDDRGAKLEYVRGHAGNAMNERADALAREAVSTHDKKAIVL
jgi:ribonuclease HI